MYILRLSLLVLSAGLSNYIQAAPTTELPPAPSAYTYIVVKYPATPITQAKKVNPSQNTSKKKQPAFVIRPIEANPAPTLAVQGRNPFSEGRKNP